MEKAGDRVANLIGDGVRLLRCVRDAAILFAHGPRNA